MISKTLIAAGLLGLSVAAQPAFAQETREVAYGDLDLASPKGHATLQSRLRAAARDVCAMGTGRVTLKEQMASQQCYRLAMKSANERYASVRMASARTR